MAGYAHPEALVDTAWVAAHGRDPGVRLVEVDVDTSAYEQGHLPGALAWNWTTQLSDPVRRDVLSKDAFERLMAQSGIANDTTVVLYGDNNNWFAAWALWQMKLYGHADVRLMDGGRRKWVEEGRDLTTAVPSPPPARYVASGPDLALRAFLRRGHGGIRERQRRLRRRAQPRRVHGPHPGAAGPARDLPARRPHPGRQEHPLEPGLQRRRHLQVGPGAAARSMPARASPASGRRSPTAASASARATPGSC